MKKPLPIGVDNFEKKHVKEAAAKWVKAGAVSHAICLYAHAEELQRQFFHYGFGVRCLDAIRPMELIDCEPCEDYDYAELPKTKFIPFIRFIWRYIAITAKVLSL